MRCGMTHRFGTYMVCIIILLIAVYSAHGFGKKTFIAPRSVSCDAALGLVAWQSFLYRCTDDNYMVFSLMPTYMHSFNTDRITRYLFGSGQLAFTGSQVANRAVTDILADYFGLPGDYSSVVIFDPHVINFMLRFDWYYGLDCLVPGLFVRFILPIVNTKWDLYLHECVINSGSATGFYPAGYMGPMPLTRDQLAPSVEIALQGKTTFGDMQEPLAFGKIFGRETTTRSADLIYDTGYLIVHNDQYHAGIIVRVAAPIGNRSGAQFLFDPTVGNGHHWEIGGGLTGHANLYACGNHQLSLWSELYATHLFGAHGRRSFDFASQGQGSRYMLIEELASPSQDLNVAFGIPSAEQYQGRLLPAINKSTLTAKISIPVQVDWVIKGSYRYHCFELDCGYNFWARSAERLHKRGCFPERCFAFKGDAQLYGFDAQNNPIELASTEHAATLQSGQGTTNFTAGLSFRNANIDNPVTALDGTNMVLNQLNTVDSAALDIVQGPVETSNPVNFIMNADIDEQSALMPCARSHKFFVNIAYIGEPVKCLEPYCGVGGYVEFARTDPDHNSAFSQWSIWAKGGIAFD